MVMMSGLASVSGCRSQSPNWSSITKPAPQRNDDSDSAFRNRSVLQVSSGPSQAGLM